LFLGILSHDLRGPLHAIVLSARVLMIKGRIDAGSHEVASGISTSANAMARMINDLLDFTGGGLGLAMPLSLAAMDLASVCEEVLQEIRAAHPTAEVRFGADGDLTGEWDADRLRQVVSNLLANAVHHGGGAGPVDLSAGAEGSHVRLVVRNGGPPIPPDALATIFDPLVRVTPEVQKRRRPGSIGLGLYIAREVALAHGGDIDVTSSAENGTSFTVRLPRHRSTA
jgi:signal transduction histidine kinase